MTDQSKIKEIEKEFAWEFGLGPEAILKDIEGTELKRIADWFLERCIPKEELREMVKKIGEQIAPPDWNEDNIKGFNSALSDLLDKLDIK